MISLKAMIIKVIIVNEIIRIWAQTHTHTRTHELGVVTVVG